MDLCKFYIDLQLKEKERNELILDEIHKMISNLCEPLLSYSDDIFKNTSTMVPHGTIVDINRGDF